MGILRTLLALTVVLAHADVDGALVGARNAVQMFYVMSGFLMSYVLTESRPYATVKDFFVNRYLRLYPIYFVVAVCTLIVLAFAKHSELYEVYRRGPAVADLFLATVNVTLFGQDWTHFLAVDAGRLVFSSNFSNSEVLLYRGLLVPQAWTIGVELAFYLIAPFVLPRRNVLWLLLGFSIAVRLSLFAVGVGMQDPWSYRFFPAELMFFLLGALAHQVGLPLYRQLFAARLGEAAALATGLLIVLTLVYPWLPGAFGVKELALFGVFIVLVPMAFVYQGNNAVDRWIGELSYPIYINHLLVIVLVAAVGRKWALGREASVAAVLVVSIASAVVLNRQVAAPVERIRRRYRTVPAVRMGTV